MRMLKIRKILNKKTLEKKLSIKFLKKNALLSFHPVTFSHDYGLNELKTLLKCLEKEKIFSFLYLIQTMILEMKK